MSYLGRGLDDIAGKPFGWAWHQERDEIRAHLRQRGFTGYLEFRVSAIQNRLHRNRPTYAERCAARAAARPIYAPDPQIEFTLAELERLAEHFNGANDDIGQSIAAKVRKAMEQ